MKVTKKIVNPPSEPEYEYTVTLGGEEARLLAWLVGSVTGNAGSRAGQFFAELMEALPMYGSDPFSGKLIRLEKPNG